MGDRIHNILKSTGRAGAAAVLVSLVCVPAFAQSETLSTNVSATVQNSFTLTETTALDFGVFVAIADTVGSNTATLTVLATGGAPSASNNAPAQFIIVDASSATNGVFGVSNAAPNTTLNVSTVDTNATCGTCGGGNPILTLVSTPQSATATTDGTGAATINVGATLTTATTPAQQYADGTYTGSFNLVVSY
jgi:Domain of unknown function (DUF4402)